MEGCVGGQKTTYGRSQEKPTVGRSTDLPWVAKTTYSRFYFGGARRRCLDGLESESEDAVAFPSECRDFLDGGSVWLASRYQGGGSLLRSFERGALGWPLRLRRAGEIGTKLVEVLVD